MVEAIEAVLKAIQRGTPHPGRVRALALSAFALTLLALAAFWLPGAIIRYTASLVPEGARVEISKRLRTEIRRVTGAPCADTAGLRALEKLEQRLFPGAVAKLVVLPSALAETTHLPDGTLLIGHALVEDHETPEVLAGYLLAEELRRHRRDPLERLLSEAGLGAALQLLTTGRLEDETLRRHAEILIAAPPEPMPDASLIAAMNGAQVSSLPYAYARDISGESTLQFIEAGQEGNTNAPLLGDGDWIALQRICEG